MCVDCRDRTAIILLRKITVTYSLTWLIAVLELCLKITQILNNELSNKSFCVEPLKAEITFSQSFSFTWSKFMHCHQLLAWSWTHVSGRDLGNFTEAIPESLWRIQEVLSL